MNQLYFGDNLKWLLDRKEFPDASVDLVDFDPPFNSNADYNVLFREPPSSQGRDGNARLCLFPCGKFLKARIIPERIEHRIEPEQRRSEWHAQSQCALVRYRE